MPRLENFHFSMTSQMYFAAGPSGLLIIVRDLKHVDEGEMVGFKVYKLDETERRWVETNSLDDGMLFLGLNTSMWFSSSNFHECRGNSIYFTDEHINYDGLLGWGGDSGIFHLKDGSFHSIYDDYMKPLYPRPVWVVPNP
ncbi:hypothetical protein QJS04_geneDACA006009 [Acorus gramineus]|uniref:KIB1-4 beta-propeller domain-containing protein n=1 Tax=Acorus gramineus TaxID=55184 RepID=A0AAV9B5Z3_ACOGR|nr:hypothetical protein QJS04_geneDACA006009 [Acorus gramineus]